MMVSDLHLLMFRFFLLLQLYAQLMPVHLSRYFAGRLFVQKTAVSEMLTGLWLKLAAIVPDTGSQLPQNLNIFRVILLRDPVLIQSFLFYSFSVV
jgi:hypothetical protein